MNADLRDAKRCGYLAFGDAGAAHGEDRSRSFLRWLCRLLGAPHVRLAHEHRELDVTAGRRGGRALSLAEAEETVWRVRVAELCVLANCRAREGSTDIAYT